MGVWFALGNSATFDEPMHYYAGYAYLERGDFSVSYHLPPLSKEIALLPVFLLSRLHLVAAPRFQTAAENPAAGLDLIYRSPLSAQTQLLLARSAMLLLGVLTIVVVGRWAGRLWGTPAALVATGLAVTEPTFIAHSSVVTPDGALACFFTLCFYLLWCYRENGSRRTFVLAGVAFGAALGSKFPAILVAPAFALIAVLDADSGAWTTPWRRRLPAERRRHPWLEAAAALAFLGVIAFVTLAATYAGFALGYWWDGFLFQIGHGSQEHTGFLFGRYTEHGWWYYFPLAFALKTPIPTLAMIAAALVLPRAGRALRRPEVLLLIVPPAVFLAAMMWGGADIGVRYILPVYPFLFVLAARVATFAARPLVPILLAAAIAWNAGDVLRIAPHFLASANALAGGPRGVARLLSDSNVDWGQGLIALKRYMDREGIPALYLAYFGMARPSDYGIVHQPIPSFGGEETDYLLPPTARQIVAVSATDLWGVYLADHDLYAWLRAKTPIATAGYAIYVYDLTDDPELHCRLADAYGRYMERRLEALERAKCESSTGSRSHAS